MLNSTSQENQTPNLLDIVDKFKNLIDIQAANKIVDYETKIAELTSVNQKLNEEIKLLQQQLVCEVKETNRVLQEVEDENFYRTYFKGSNALGTVLCNARNDAKSAKRITDMMNVRDKLNGIFGRSTVDEYAKFCEKRGRFPFYHQYLEDPNVEKNITNWRKLRDTDFFRAKQRSKKKIRGTVLAVTK